MLEKQALRAGADVNDDLLFWTCDALQCDKGANVKTVSKAYACLVPWDVIASLLAVGAITLLAAFFGLFLLQSAWWLPAPLKVLLPELYGCLFLSVVICGFVVGAQVPRKLTRQGDALIMEFLFFRHVVPLTDVLELVVLDSGWQFFRLLRRWHVFPFGLLFKLFCGVPSSRGAVCVLLTTHCCWSFIFCLKEPVKFLLDTQKPLDTCALYETSRLILLRAGADFSSQELGDVPGGRRLTILEQKAHRVRVRFEDGRMGWMSYVSKRGFVLLRKVRSGLAVPQGTVGASELSFQQSTYGSAIEMPKLVERPGLGSGNLASRLAPVAEPE